LYATLFAELLRLFTRPYLLRLLRAFIERYPGPQKSRRSLSFCIIYRAFHAISGNLKYAYWLKWTKSTVLLDFNR